MRGNANNNLVKFGLVPNPKIWVVTACLGVVIKTMKFSIMVRANARHESVTKADDGSYRVCVNAPAQGGQANAAVIELLAQFLKVPKSSLRILHGHKGKKKMIEWVR